MTNKPNLCGGLVDMYTVHWFVWCDQSSPYSMSTSCTPNSEAGTNMQFVVQYKLMRLSMKLDWLKAKTKSQSRQMPESYAIYEVVDSLPMSAVWPFQ